MSRAASESWLACPEKVRPINDLRRPEAERESWAPPKIKKREAVVLAEKGWETPEGGPEAVLPGEEARGGEGKRRAMCQCQDE